MSRAKPVMPSVAEVTAPHAAEQVCNQLTQMKHVPVVMALASVVMLRPNYRLM